MRPCARFSSSRGPKATERPATPFRGIPRSTSSPWQGCRGTLRTCLPQEPHGRNRRRIAHRGADRHAPHRRNPLRCTAPRTADCKQAPLASIPGGHLFRPLPEPHTAVSPQRGGGRSVIRSTPFRPSLLRDIARQQRSEDHGRAVVTAAKKRPQLGEETAVEKRDRSGEERLRRRGLPQYRFHPGKRHRPLRGMHAPPARCNSPTETVRPATKRGGRPEGWPPVVRRRTSCAARHSEAIIQPRRPGPSSR